MLEDLFAGVTKGILQYSEESLPGLIDRLRNRDVAFVGNLETIRELRKTKRTPEWLLLRPCILDRDLAVLFRMGIYLKSIEQDQDETTALRQTIYKKYGTEGLYIAQAVQNGIVHKLLFEHSPIEGLDDSEMTPYVENILRTVTDFVFFISPNDSFEKKERILLNNMDAHNREVYVLCGAFRGANVVKKITESIRDKLDGYEIESHSQSFKTIVYFIKKGGFDSVLTTQDSTDCNVPPLD